MRKWLSFSLVLAALIGCRKGPEGPAGPAGPAFSTPREGYIRGTARVTDTTSGQRVTLSYNYEYLSPDYLIPGLYAKGSQPNTIDITLYRIKSPLSELESATINLGIDTSQSPTSPSYLAWATADLTIIASASPDKIKGYIFSSSLLSDTVLVRQLSVAPNRIQGKLTFIKRNVTPYDTIEMEFESRLLTEIIYQRQAR